MTSTGKTASTASTTTSGGGNVLAVEMLRWQLACTLCFSLALVVVAIFLVVAVNNLSMAIASNCCNASALVNMTEAEGGAGTTMQMFETFRKRQEQL